MPSVKALGDARIAIEKNRIATRDHMLAESAEEKAQAANFAQALSDEIEGILKRYEKELVVDETDRKMARRNLQAFVSYRPKVEAVLAASTANDVRLALKLQRGISVELIDALSEHSEHNRKLADDLRKHNGEDYERAKWIELVTIVLALAASGGLGFVLVREIRRRLNNLASFMNEVSDTLDFT